MDGKATTFGAEIRRLRGDRSATELAKAAAVSQAFLSRLETGDRQNIGVDAFFRLVRQLGVTADHFAVYFLPVAGEIPSEPVNPPPARAKKRKA